MPSNEEAEKLLIDVLKGGMDTIIETYGYLEECGKPFLVWKEIWEQLEAQDPTDPGRYANVMNALPRFPPTSEYMRLFFGYRQIGVDIEQYQNGFMWRKEFVERAVATGNLESPNKLNGMKENARVRCLLLQHRAEFHSALEITETICRENYR